MASQLQLQYSKFTFAYKLKPQIQFIFFVVYQISPFMFFSIFHNNVVHVSRKNMLQIDLDMNRSNEKFWNDRTSSKIICKEANLSFALY